MVCFFVDNQYYLSKRTNWWRAKVKKKAKMMKNKKRKRIKKKPFFTESTVDGVLRESNRYKIVEHNSMNQSLYELLKDDKEIFKAMKIYNQTLDKKKGKDFVDCVSKATWQYEERVKENKRQYEERLKEIEMQYEEKTQEERYKLLKRMYETLGLDSYV